MSTTFQCVEKARELTQLAEAEPNPEVREQWLVMAEMWLVLSTKAEWQDAHPLIKTYRIQ
jgi:hypothetical protein